MNIRILLIPLIMTAAGCSLGHRQQPALHDFGVPVSVPLGKQADNTLVTVNAPKWLMDTRIRYRLLYAAPTQVRFYTLDRWLAPPPELFEQQLAASGKILNYALHIRLLDFEQQFDAPDKARALLRFYVEAFASDNKILLAAQEISLEKVTQTADAAGAVSAFADLTRQAGDKIQDWLARLPDKP
jgi:cholesterol transport system auxiliary component